MKHLKTLIHCGLLAAASVTGALAAVPLGTAFNYQGRLEQDGLPAPNGIYQMNFALFADAMGGNSLFTYNVPLVPVTNGLFNTSLDFGTTAFAGEERWLQISVRTNNNELSFTLLLPRTSLAPAPNAIFASTAATATSVAGGAVSASGLATVDPPASGQVLTYNDSQLVWQSPAAISGAWATNGITGVPGSFLGTVNNLPLELRADNTRALRLEPNATAANIIGGFAGNYAENGVVAGVLGGGGAASWANLPGANRVLDSASTLGGGISNSVGTANGDPNDAVYASLVGGYANSAEGQSSTIGGGAYNRATSRGSIVGGGWFGVASGPWSAIGGGFQNIAGGNSAAIVGGRDNQAQGFAAAVGGGENNLANSDYAFIGGGSGNAASAYSAVGGGSQNNAAGTNACVPGGANNYAGGFASFAAGANARALHNGSFVWADEQYLSTPPFSLKEFESAAPNQFSVRSSGGVRFETTRMEVTGSGNGPAIAGINLNTASSVGVYGEGRGFGLSGRSAFTGIVGRTSAADFAGQKAIHGVAGQGNYAGFFDGDVHVNGAFTVNGSKLFKIDHPLDPANKYLLHACVESPDVKNIYDGNVTTDANGEAVITLPSYFEALNRDFRYQLTVIGQFAQAIVSTKIQNNQFTIKTDRPGVEVSWQVTGIRQDAHMKAHPMVVEQDKPANERGLYHRPELFGQPAEKGLGWALDSELRKRAQAGPAEPAATAKP